MLPLACLSYEHFYNKSWCFRFWFANFLLATSLVAGDGRRKDRGADSWGTQPEPKTNPSRLLCDLHATYGLYALYLYLWIYIWLWVCSSSCSCRSNFRGEINLQVFALLQLSDSGSHRQPALASILRIRQVARREALIEHVFGRCHLHNLLLGQPFRSDALRFYCLLCVLVPRAL